MVLTGIYMKRNIGQGKAGERAANNNNNGKSDLTLATKVRSVLSWIKAFSQPETL